MRTWAWRAQRAAVVTPVVNLRSVPKEPTLQVAPLRLLSFNIQVGIQTTRYRHYVTNGWKHVLPHMDRALNLRRIADVVSDYDVVALQEVDSGSLRSGYINQVEYVADRGQFPYWYAQLNRDLGPLAQHGNGVLTRIRPSNMEDHKLPGAIPGRGAIVLRLPYAGRTVLLVLLHLSLGDRSRKRQLDYVTRLIADEEHVIVMGDLNSSTTRLLLETPLAGTNLLPVEDVQPTYPAWRPHIALDHVLVSPTFRVDDYRVLDCTVSDHRPVAVSLSFR
ncbi:MAG: endonuclease/exonuclease/phosphatase family protein [Pseudomonadales bacterium]|nr:endonuclease/exonuclease/phosphatase family protein [Pseudomonadales bacterium]MCP5183522.1 endonuclease/exonuclease/phosphatase family protein [Pseudomonadales bacterium]